MKKIFRLFGVTTLLLATVAPVFTSCEKDEYDTQQYRGGVNLNVWGPSLVARGGELRFLGSGMNRITSISLPGSGEITDIKVVSDEEIRITVPQDAEPGKIILHYSDGDITSLTELSFTEPISLDEISPLTVKPGALLTLKGDYLNLISEVIFTEDVVVGEENFLSHSRKEITLTVPEEAQNGPIIISDGKLPIPNHIISEEEISVMLPSVAKVIDLSGAKPGESVTITVTDIDLVKKVLVPDGSEVVFSVEGDKLTFNLPENITDGTVCIIPASGVKVAVATIGVALPEEVTADPAEGIWGGDIISFKGINMELVTKVSFPDVEEAVIPTESSSTKISVTVPEGTRSGMAILHTASGGSVEVGISTLKPEALAYNPSPAALAATLSITGRNLSHVASVTLGGSVNVEVTNVADNGFSINVPATLAAGNNSVTLNLSNGESVECPAIELTAPECAYATELPAEDAEINAGEVFTVTVANADKLMDVEVNGNKVQYILNGSRLIIQVPESAGKNSAFTLISSNGSISYPISFIPATHVENVIFSEVRDLGSWAGEDSSGAFRLYKESVKGVPAGAKLVFHIAPYQYTQIQLNDANWGQMEMLVPALNDATVEFTLTAEILDRILKTEDGWSDTAMVIQGEGTVVSKVHIELENSLETVIWNSGWTCAGWGGNQDLAWGGYDWSAVKPGTVMRLYTTPTVADGDWWCLSLRHGDSWANLPDPIPAQYDNPGNPLEVVLTADVINDLVANGGLVITGSDYQLDKITLE